MLLLRLGGHRARPSCGRLRLSWLRRRLCFGGLAIFVSLSFSCRLHIYIVRVLFVWSGNVLRKEVGKSWLVLLGRALRALRPLLLFFSGALLVLDSLLAGCGFGFLSSRKNTGRD